MTSTNVVSHQRTFVPSPGRATAAGILLLFGSCLPLLGATLLTPNLANIAGAFPDTAAKALLVSLIVTAPGAMIALISPFAGTISDRIGRKRLLVTAAVVYSVFGVAPVFLGSLLGIVASRALLGVCEAVVMTVCTALIADYFTGKRRLKYLSLQTVFTTVSAVVFILIGGIVAQANWRAPFWIYVMGIVVAIPLAVLAWEPVRRELGPVTALRVPWRLLALPLVFTFISGIGNNVVLVNASFLLPARGFPADPGAIGLVIALLSIGTAASALSFRALARFGPRRILVPAYAVQAVGLGIIAFGDSVPAFILGAFFAALGFGMQVPTLITWALSQVHDVRVQGRAAGWWTSAFWIGQLLFSFIFIGLVIVAGGQFAAVAVFAVIYVLVAVAASVLIPRNASLVQSHHDDAAERVVVHV